MRFSEKTLMIILAFFLSAQASALQVEKIDFPDAVKVDSEELKLNGAGVRSKKKFGINWKVYVAGLYVTNKTADAEALIDSPEAKMIRMFFLRSVDKKSLEEGWTESLTSNCRQECQNLPNWRKMLSELLMDVDEKSRIQINFFKGAVLIQVQAKETRAGRIVGEAFSKNLLAAFIGAKPPTEDFKKNLLRVAN